MSSVNPDRCPACIPRLGSAGRVPARADRHRHARAAVLVDRRPRAGRVRARGARPGDGAVWRAGPSRAARPRSSSTPASGLTSNTAYTWRVRSRSAGEWSLVGRIDLRDGTAGCRGLGRRVGRARAAGRRRRALEHRRLDPRPRTRHPARGAAAPPAAAAAVLRGAGRARPRPPVRDRARVVLGVRERRAGRRPGARARLGRLRAPHLGAVVRRHRTARRGRERAGRRARRRLVGGPPRPHGVERAVRHAHLGDLAAAPRLCRRRDRGRGIRSRRPQRDRPVDVCRPLRR